MSTLGLFGSLNMATRSLSTQRVGTEVAGHNLANVNNPAYARQRVSIATDLTVNTQLGPQGTGAVAVSIQRLRDNLIDQQVINQTGITNYWTSQQQALQYAQANLGQEIDRQASGAEGLAASGSVGGQHGLAEALTGFFSALSGLSTSSSAEDVDSQRANVLAAASTLAARFRSVEAQLTTLNTGLNDAVVTETADANRLLADIAKLNEQIVNTEAGVGGVANDLRDQRQSKLEELAGHLNFTSSESSIGVIDISIGGVPMTAGSQVLNTLETFDPGNGQLQLRATDGGSPPTTVPVTLTGGRIQGTIDARDGAVADLRQQVNALAAGLITAVNTQHAAGYDPAGNTGVNFFSGTDAATIGVALSSGNQIAAADVSGGSLNNANAALLAKIVDNKTIAGFGGQTVNQYYNQAVANLGNNLSTANQNLNNEQIIQDMLERQRDSVSGVSIDEEMTDLIKYQRAFEASARLVSTLNEMLATLVNLGR